MPFRSTVTLKILLVDDEADIVEVVQDRLEHYGFNVVTAGSGVDALKKLAVEAFDGIFLDIKMPEMDGMEALGEIRKRDTKIPVIILTASSTQATAIEAMNRGANDYILKPLEWDELKVKIEKLYHLTLR
jgi:DNA-binding response OmpR family regulator